MPMAHGESEAARPNKLRDHDVPGGAAAGRPHPSRSAARPETLSPRLI